MNEIKVYTGASFAESKYLEKNKAEFEKRLGKGTLKRECDNAARVISGSPQLQKCSPESILKAIYDVSLVGLSLNPVLKEAYLIPRWNTKAGCNECTLLPAYGGLVKLAQEASGIPLVAAQLVHKNDTFKVNMATGDIEHYPAEGERGDITQVYAIARLANGMQQVELMTMAEVYEVRECSDSWRAFVAKKITSCVWDSNEGEMTRKTVLKRLCKYLPKVKAEAAVRYGEAERMDNAEFLASDAQVFYIDALLHTSTLGEDEKEQIEIGLGHDLSAIEAGKIIEKLKANQMDHLKERGVINNAKQMNKSLDAALEKE